MDLKNLSPSKSRMLTSILVGTIISAEEEQMIQDIAIDDACDVSQVHK